MTIQPRDRDDLASWLQQNDRPFSVIDAGEQRDVMLSLSGLDRVIDYQPDETNVTVEAGILLSDLNALLSGHGQWVPTLLDRVEHRLIDALLLNSYHPRSLTCSPLATSVLGGWFVTNKGMLFRSGSRVVKSVAGYDTHRAFVGSRGALGLPVEVTLKVLPKPEVFFRFLGHAADVSRLVQFDPLVLEPIGEHVLIELAGFREDIEEDIARLRSERLIVRTIEEEWPESLVTLHSRAKEDPRAHTILDELAGALNNVRATE